MKRGTVRREPVDSFAWERGGSEVVARAALCPQFTLHLNFYPTDIPRVGFED